MNSSPIIKPTKDLVEAVKTKTDIIGASVALETGGNLAAVKAKTDLIPAYPAQIYTNPILCHPGLAAAPQITSGTPAWTPGSWHEFVAANAITADFVVLGAFLHDYDTMDVEHVWEIGVGASGSETVIVQLPGHFDEESQVGWMFCIPVFFSPVRVAANTRVSGRISTSIATKNVNMKIMTCEI